MNIGIIGSGNIGLTVGKHWLDAGHTVRFAARDLDKLRASLRGLGPGAAAVAPAEAATFGDVVFFAPPFGAWPQLARELGPLLRGKIVVDATNPYPDRDGDLARQVIAAGRGSGAYVASLLPGAQVVKAFNTLYYVTLAQEAHRAGDRLALPLAGDDAAAVTRVAGLVRDAGFDPVPLDSLARAKDFDAGSPAYNRPVSAAELSRVLERVPA
jgi:predicted dinucleotide-binding enzyme